MVHRRLLSVQSMENTVPLGRDEWLGFDGLSLEMAGYENGEPLSPRKRSALKLDGQVRTPTPAAEEGAQDLPPISLPPPAKKKQ